MALIFTMKRLDSESSNFQKGHITDMGVAVLAPRFSLTPKFVISHLTLSTGSISWFSLIFDFVSKLAFLVFLS